MLLIKLGLRNLWRRRRRSVLTWLMILLGTTLIVYGVGLAEGSYGDMIRLATQSFTGQFQVQAEGFDDKPSLFKTVKDPEAVERALLAREGVLAVTRRVECAGLLAAGAKTSSAYVLGVDPAREGAVTTLPKTLVQGRWLSDDDAAGGLPLLLGRGLARRLGVAPGDTLSFVGQAADGSLAAELFILTGILASGAAEMDAGLALMRLEDAQSLLALEGRAHRIVGAVDDWSKLDAILAGVDPGEGNALLSWRKLLPELDRTIDSDRQGTRIFLVIILLMVTLGVTNTMMMAVFERTREFGVMAALGTTPGKLLATVLWEAFWLSASGVLAGVGAGALLNRWVPLPVGSEGIDFGGVLIEVMRGRNCLLGNLYYPALIFAAGLLAGVIPALRAARLSPAAALRKV